MPALRRTDLRAVDQRSHRSAARHVHVLVPSGSAGGVFAQFGDRTIHEVVVYLGPLSVNVLIADLAPEADHA